MYEHVVDNKMISSQSKAVILNFSLAITFSSICALLIAKMSFAIHS